MQTAPFGTWTSNISSEYLASKSVRLAEPKWQGQTLFWLASLPAEKGRQTIMAKTTEEPAKNILPQPWSARSRVHEYGGGSYCLSDQFIYFVEASDQQIYQLDMARGEVIRFTNAPESRFADLHLDPTQTYLYCVCEDHSPTGPWPKNRLVRFALKDEAPGAEQIIDQQHDFIASPSVSPSGQWLVYLTWDNPDMPWDQSQLWLRKISPEGDLESAHPLTASLGQSVFQPQWRANDDLFWVSDKTNWWNLYSASAHELAAAYGNQTQIEGHSIAPMEAEFATPQWTFAMSTYAFINSDQIIATYTQNGFWFLCEIHYLNQGWQLNNIQTQCNSLRSLTSAEGQCAFIGAAATSADAIYKIDNQQIKLVTDAPTELNEADLAKAQPFRFATGDANCPEAFGFYYPPTNSQFSAPPNSKPPLIVIGHGGPTGCGDPSLNYKIQFWTSRGFALIDVNYRGSTGYGRRFRQALNFVWGIADVEDLCDAANHAVNQGWANPQQLIIKGGSAGGYSVLAALTDRDTFNAGVSLYGIADLELLATDTHKFEARYLDKLIGPYPEQKSIYIERSPIHKAKQINVPLLVFQGLQDKVVPPNQAEAIVKSVEDNGVPVAYVTYEDEAHGFRSAPNICHQVEAELYFYQTIFNLGEIPVTNTQIKLKNWPTD